MFLKYFHFAISHHIKAKWLYLMVSYDFCFSIKIKSHIIVCNEL